MERTWMIRFLSAGATLAIAMSCFAASLPDDVKSAAESRAKQIASWGKDSALVSAVKAYNSAPPGESKAMTNDAWKTRTLIDPMVRALTKNQAGMFLRNHRMDGVTEAFVSGANGGKVGFLSKPTSWSHKGKDKHDLPMKGKTWYGPVEVDESSGQQQIQIAVPVLDGKRPIGSLVVGFATAKLK